MKNYMSRGAIKISRNTLSHGESPETGIIYQEALYTVKAPLNLKKAWTISGKAKNYYTIILKLI